MAKVRLGIEKLVGDESSRIRGRNVGLLAHPASTTSNLAHSMNEILLAGANLRQLFGPEHGFGGESQDMEAVGDYGMGPGGIALHSLYGSSYKTLSPPVELLKDLDVLVVDLFDVGSRYYTFVWTALLCLRVCHEVGTELIITDRPNPLGGLVVEGAPQDGEFCSFVGLHPVSNRHGLTPGELISYCARAEGIEDGLTVIEMDGWQRSMLFNETELPWVFPSPNMPTFDTALVYPGGCLIEATWASEGRGTTRPFELIGATGVGPSILAKELESMSLPGVVFRPTSFKPSFQKHADEICGGVQIHVTDPQAFLPYLTGVAVVRGLKKVMKTDFVWREEPYEFVSNIPAIDLLTGSSQIRIGIDEDAQLTEIAATWHSGQREFEEKRKAHFLYE